MADYSTWEIANQNIPLQNIPLQNRNKGQYEDWELGQPMQPMQQQETFGQALYNAPERLYEDLAKAGMSAYNAIPGYYEKAKTEFPGLIQTAREHPGHLLGQGFAGSQELINQLAQLPTGLAGYGEKRLNLLPRGTTEAIQKFSPEDTSGAIQQLFGEPQYPGEALTRGAVRNIPGILGGAKVASLFSGSKQGIEKAILKTHDALENRAAKGFQTVSNEAKARNVPSVPISQQLMTDIEDYFPKSKAAKKLLSDAKMGDYDALRKVQSDLYTNAKKNLRSDLEVERKRGAEMLDSREDINQAISDHFIKTGNTDLNKILNSSRKDYKTLNDIYYHPAMNKSIIKMVDSESRKMPKNITKILEERSKPMQRFKDFHAGLEKKLTGYQNKEHIANLLKKIGIPLGIGGLGAAGYMELNRPNNP